MRRFSVFSSVFETFKTFSKLAYDSFAIHSSISIGASAFEAVNKGTGLYRDNFHCESRPFLFNKVSRFVNKTTPYDMTNRKQS